MNRGRPRPGKRIKSRGLPERLDQAKKKALERLKRQQEKERRKRERELARLLCRRLGYRRGVGGDPYVGDELEEIEEEQVRRKKKHQAGTLSGATGDQPAMVGFTDLRKGQRKALQKLKRVG